MIISRFKKFLLILSISALALTFIIIQLNNYAQDSSLNEWKEGIKGYVSSMRLQKTSNKPVILFFYTDWCQNCEKLREDILSTAEVKEYLVKFLPVKINPEKGALEFQLSEEYGVFGYPTLIVLRDNDEKPILIRKTSNITPAQFIAQCQQAIEA